MKTIIAGGRDYFLGLSDYRWLDEIAERLPITEVVCGGARGADSCGKAWAEKWEIPVKMFPAKWEQYGKSAGALRNAEMAKYAQVLIAFPGGRGTANMLLQAELYGLWIINPGEHVDG